MFLYIPLSPNYVKKVELLGLNVLKLNLYPQNLANFGSLKVNNELKIGFIYWVIYRGFCDFFTSFFGGGFLIVCTFYVLFQKKQVFFSFTSLWIFAVFVHCFCFEILKKNAYIILYHIISYSIILDHTISYPIIVFCIVCDVLYCLTLHYIMILYYVTWYYVMWFMSC